MCPGSVPPRLKATGVLSCLVLFPSRVLVSVRAAGAAGRLTTDKLVLACEDEDHEGGSRSGVTEEDKAGDRQQDAALAGTRSAPAPRQWVVGGAFRSTC